MKAEAAVKELQRETPRKQLETLNEWISVNLSFF